MYCFSFVLGNKIKYGLPKVIIMFNWNLKIPAISIFKLYQKNPHYFICQKYSQEPTELVYQQIILILQKQPRNGG